jgi:hypothetical protein
MIQFPLKAAFCNFLTADGRPQTAALKKNRRRRSIGKFNLNHPNLSRLTAVSEAANDPV